MVSSNLSAVHDGRSRIPSVDQPALRHPSKTGVSYETAFCLDPTPDLYLIKVAMTVPPKHFRRCGSHDVQMNALISSTFDPSALDSIR